MIHDSKMSPQAERAMIEHFSTQHITPQEAGKIASLAGVQRLVFTHLSISGTTETNAPSLIREAHTSFKGEVLVAHDLDRF